MLLLTIPSTGRTLINIPFSNPSGSSGKVELSLPGRVFAGDGTEITATITLKEDENQPDFVKLSGRLEAGFDELNPAGEVEVNLQPGSMVRLNWKVRTAQNSVYPGNLWLWLESDSSRELILAREFDLESRFVFGQPVLYFRVLFASLLVLSILVLLSNFFPKKQRPWKSINFPPQNRL